jgi:hypothetical protein
MAYDESRKRIVLFGGAGVNGDALDDTWEWNGETWVEQRTPVKPLPRAGHTAAFDAQEGGVVVFGGRDGESLKDVWRWDGAAWAELITVDRPTARAASAMVFDENRGRLMVFGGTAGGADTWELRRP